MKTKNNFCIKEGYLSQTKWHHHDDTEHHNDDHQHKVYESARAILDNFNFNRVLDIGCGSGFKLVKYFKDCEFVGLEIEPTLTWLRDKYPEHKWLESDFETKLPSFDIIICSDVVEHLTNPDELMNFINNIDFKFLVISTPERDAIQIYQKGFMWDGPPLNLSHCREWSYEEFNEYVSKFFDVRRQFMIKNKAESKSLCQIVVAKKIMEDGDE